VSQIAGTVTHHGEMIGAVGAGHAAGYVWHLRRDCRSQCARCGWSDECLRIAGRLADPAESPMPSTWRDGVDSDRRSARGRTRPL